MSAPITLPDLIKSLPTATDQTGKDILLSDAQGNPSKMSYSDHPKVVNLLEKEMPGKVMGLKDFTTKYITGLPEGSIMTDNIYQHDKAWYLNLKTGLTVDLQAVMIKVVKNHGSLLRAWANISLVIFPSSSEATDIYFVTQTTGSTADAYNAIVRKIASQAI